MLTREFVEANNGRVLNGGEELLELLPIGTRLYSGSVGKVFVRITDGRYVREGTDDPYTFHRFDPDSWQIAGFVELEPATFVEVEISAKLLKGLPDGAIVVDLDGDEIQKRGRDEWVCDELVSDDWSGEGYVTDVPLARDTVTWVNSEDFPDWKPVEFVPDSEMIGAFTDDPDVIDSLPNGAMILLTGFYQPSAIEKNLRVKSHGDWFKVLPERSQCSATPRLVAASGRGALIVSLP